MHGPEYDQIKLHSGANDLRCRKAPLNRCHLRYISYRRTDTVLVVIGRDVRPIKRPIVGDEMRIENADDLAYNDVIAWMDDNCVCVIR